jgi:hypothetical protein
MDALGLTLVATLSGIGLIHLAWALGLNGPEPIRSRGQRLWLGRQTGLSWGLPVGA